MQYYGADVSYTVKIIFDHYSMVARPFWMVVNNSETHNPL